MRVNFWRNFDIWKIREKEPAEICICKTANAGMF